jgi:hypothetical protein
MISRYHRDVLLRSPCVARPLLAVICLFVFGATLWSQPAEERRCAVTLELHDAQTGERLAGLIRLDDARGERIDPPELLPRGLGLEGELPIHRWSVVPGSEAVKLSLPRKPLTVTAFAGLETEEVRLTLDLTGKSEQTVRVPLKRFYRASSLGLRSANTHLHLMKLPRDKADRYLREVPAADGLDLLFVSYLERAGADQDYITNRYTQADLAQLAERSSVAYGNGEEHRHNFAAQGEGYGHVMLLNLRKLVLPVSIGPGIMKVGTDGLPVQRGIDTARRDGATAIWCHNRWGLEHIPNWVLGRLDAQNIFDGGAHGSYKDSFYRFLNAGFRVPFSTGTDWFIYDFARVYAPVSEMPTARSWLKSLSAGKSYITNGPLLEFTVAGKSSGDTIRLPARSGVEITAKGLGRVNFRQLELLRDGIVVRTAASRAVDGHFEAAAHWTIDMTSSGWLALRTPPPAVKGDPAPAESVAQNEFGQPIFSHTSPVYVEIAGRPIFDPTAARDLLAEVERAARQVSETAIFGDDVEKGRVLDVYHEAISELKRRLAATASGG